MHPHGVEGQRPRRQLHRSDGGLPRVPAPLPRRPRRRAAVDSLLPGHQGQQVHDPGRRGLPPLRRTPHAVPGLRQGRAHSAAPVQPHVQDLHGPGGGGRRRHLPAPGDGPGHLRQLRQCAAVHAPEAAVRHRADRQGVPQRDHAGQLHLPHARVRADGDRVLRQSRRAVEERPATRTGTSAGSRTGIASLRRYGLAREPAAARARQGRARPLRQAHGRHRVSISRSAGAS